MGKFAEKAAAYMSSDDLRLADDKAQARLLEQKQRMYAHIQPSKEEAIAKAQQLLSQIGLSAHDLGRTMRAQRQDEGIEQLVPHGDNPIGIPGREKMISLPATIKTSEWFELSLLSKQALMGAVTNPLRAALEDVMINMRAKADATRERGTRVTSDPATLPTFYPSVAMTVPKQFAKGYQSADKELDQRLNSDMDSKLEQAKREFEDALRTEYTTSRSKNASEIEAIDGLAQWWVGATGIEKEALGEINKAMGVYLAMASLLGAGSHAAVKGWVEKRDPRYQRMKAMKDLIRQRQRQSPLPILVHEEHVPSELPPELPNEEQPKLAAAAKKANIDWGSMLDPGQSAIFPMMDTVKAMGSNPLSPKGVYDAARLGTSLTVGKAQKTVAPGVAALVKRFPRLGSILPSVLK